MIDRWPLALPFLIAVIVSPAQGQSIGLRLTCVSTPALEHRLETRYGETVMRRGVAHNGALVQLFVNAKKEWTMVLKTPNGQSCVMATGTDWDVPSVVVEPGRDS